MIDITRLMHCFASTRGITYVGRHRTTENPYRCFAKHNISLFGCKFARYEIFRLVLSSELWVLKLLIFGRTSCRRFQSRTGKDRVRMFSRKVGKFPADYMASCCRKNISNFKILLLGLVTLIHNPNTVDLCQKFWRTSTYVTLNAAATK